MKFVFLILAISDIIALVKYFFNNLGVPNALL